MHIDPQASLLPSIQEEVHKGGDRYANRQKGTVFRPPSWVEGYDPRPIQDAYGFPLPGCYVTRFSKDCAPVPVVIWWEDGDRDPETGDLLSDQRLLCSIEERGLFDVTTEHPAGWPFWPITTDRHAFMVAELEWLRVNEPNNPKVNPRRRARLAQAPLI